MYILLYDFMEERETQNTMMTKLEEYLKDSRLLADGAFGTYYAQLSGERETAAEWANLWNPGLVKQIHREYIEAGSHLIRTNTFAANRETLLCSKEEQSEILIRGFALAKEAVRESGKEAYIAADIGPVPERLHTSHADALGEYEFICDTFLGCGADIFLFETFSDAKYMEELVSHIRQTVKEEDKLPFIMVQFCLNRYGYSRTGISARRLLSQAAEVEGVKAVGFNCGIGAGHMLEVLEKCGRAEGKYLMAMPNSGYPQLIQDRAVYLDNSQYFAERIGDAVRLGADIVGGCCGTNPEYIRRAAGVLARTPAVFVRERQKETKEEAEKQKTPNAFLERLRSGRKVIAVELDPPFDACIDKIMERANILRAAGADILTFADSPMARARMDSVLTAVKVEAEAGIPVMPHISCRDKNMIAMRAQLLGAYANRIRNLLIVTGDPIPGSGRGQVSSVFDFNSIRLMEFINELNEEHWQQERMCYGGALNYARANIDAEIRRMEKKIAAGASYFLTQPIFSDEDIEKIRYIRQRVDTRILCGIMPLVNYRNAMFIKNEISGIHVPDEVADAFSPDMTREEGEAAGTAIAGQVMRKLEDIAAGYYFMLPFNRTGLVSMCLDCAGIRAEQKCHSRGNKKEG